MDILKIQRQLQEEYAIKKIRAEGIASENRVKALKNKKYADLCEKERALVFDVAREKAAQKPDKAEISEMDSALKLVRKQIAECLSSLKLKPSDFEAKYECSICKDTGFVGGEPCSCYKKRKNELLIIECGLKKENLVGFDGFNPQIFKNEKQREEQTKLKEKLEKWCDSFPSVKKTNIVILGETGVGKTFLAKCVAKTMLEKGFSVLFVSAFEMNNLMMKFHTTFDSSKQEYISTLLESDLVIIDDLGTEPIIKNITLNYLYLVLSERERFGRPTIITSNLSTEAIDKRYGERIYSRLADKKTGAIFALHGEDLRTNK